MAKKIYMTETDVDDIVDELRQTLTGMKCYGRIDIKRAFKSDERSVFLHFTSTAWVKMATLVARYDTEVQWHGLVRRLSESAFEIFDIVVPPHEVTGTTVTSEYKPYTDWLNGLDDETFNAVKFHGHSHVNMPVSPSSTDEKYRLDLITQLPKPVNGMDVFYIFLIINKSHKWSAEVYDLTNNALYSTADISIDTYLSDSGECLEDFMTEAKRVAISRTYSQPYYRGHQYGGAVCQGTKETQPTSVTPITQTGNRKKNGGGGKCFGFNSWDEYYAATYGTDLEEKDSANRPTAQSSAYPRDDDEDDDPSSPFYVKQWGCT